MVGGKGFDAFFREQYVPAYGVALRVLGDAFAAEDAACEALARSWASWRRVQGVDSQRAWVIRVTTNVSIDMIRRRRTVAVGVADAGASTSFGESAEDRVRLAEALRRLPKRQREVVVLRFIADMTEVQVAEHLSISQGAVKQHARRGLAALRGALEGAEVNLAF